VRLPGNEPGGGPKQALSRSVFVFFGGVAGVVAALEGFAIGLPGDFCGKIQVIQTVTSEKFYLRIR